MMGVRIIMISMLVWLSAVVSYATTRTYVETSTHREYARLGDIPEIERDITPVAANTNQETAKLIPAALHTVDADALPKPISRYSREEGVVYFDANQSTLSPAMARQMDALIRILQSESHINGVRIIGYADHSGSALRNEKLSRMRAENVKRYLMANGLADSWVVDTRWLGAQPPPSRSCRVVAGDMPQNDCLQKDRRVEVEVDYTPDLRASR